MRRGYYERVAARRKAADGLDGQQEPSPPAEPGAARSAAEPRLSRPAPVPPSREDAAAEEALAFED